MAPHVDHQLSPVLIAGAGPTGLTAALELARLGVPVLIIDKMKAPATSSRAIGVQACTPELMELCGLGGRVCAAWPPGTGRKRVWRR
jgi:2-polyprenyl-6-methoxyphenol hydroxylase-like FAD-dependent oxidoreductase